MKNKEAFELLNFTIKVSHGSDYQKEFFHKMLKGMLDAMEIYYNNNHKKNHVEVHTTPRWDDPKYFKDHFTKFKRNN